ncbi:hypothetical protein PWT90_03737 [Aphanocladium album]|nr:hypothetical protein PWT90_03737 [Aphanocladium album]
MELAPASAGASKEPQAGLQLAIQDFQNILTQDQRGKLGKIGVAREAETVMIFTAQLDRENQLKKGRGIASRLHTVLQSVQSFSTVVETFVSSHPEIAALVWGSVKLTLLIAVNFTSHFEALSGVFMSFSKHCPRFAQYQALYPASTRLQTALCDFHASIIRCWQQKLKKAILQSFEQELQSDLNDIHNLGKEVKAEIALAAVHAERQDQKLQALDRTSAAKSRSRLLSLMPRVERGLDEINEMRLNQSIRKSREERLRLLQWLSSYDHLSVFREAFGAGKTVLCAHVVNYIFQNKDPSDRVSFFFVTHDNAESLRAETLMRSMIRQFLNSLSLSENFENRLTDLNKTLYVDHDSWVSLLQDVIQQSGIYFLIIDGLDECDAVERRAVLDALQSLVNAASNLRIFITSRDSLGLDLRGRPLVIQHVSMACDSLTRDIRSYVDTSIQERLQQKELMVGDPRLLTEIIDTLTSHADGMFLWVSFLFNEICAGSCDADIRNALNNLPKSLEETYARIISRIGTLTRRTELMQRIFRWVAAAKRPLALEELREAVAIEIGQTHRRTDLLTHDISRVVLWSENILQIAEEEPRQVRFAHSSIYDFITKKASSQRLADFQVDIKEVNHLLGELCVTYLNFDDFNTTITRRQQPVQLPPMDMLNAVYSRELKLTKSATLSNAVTKMVSKYRKDVPDLGKAAESYGGAAAESIQNCYPFLEYAAAFWPLHTVDFQNERSRTWNLLLHLVVDDSTPASRPWEAEMYDSSLLIWSQKTRHRSLFRHSISGIKTYRALVGFVFLYTAADGDEEFVAIALPTMLQFVTTAPATSMDSPTYMLAHALEVASNMGHANVVEHLMKTGLELDAAAALQAASEDGRLEVVELLLRYNVKINDIVYPKGSTLICSGIRRKSGDRIGYGQTALQAACQHGHIEVVERLLAANADVNAAAGQDGGKTALEAAYCSGRMDIVERLLIAGADVHDDPAAVDALLFACDGGYLGVVERLLAAGLDMSVFGNTALLYAKLQGHLEISELLLKAGVEL